MKAQERGAEKLRPGNTGGDVMRAINDALKGSNYAAAPRSSGHAVGLEVLEKPFISPDDETVLEPGMVISVHPVSASRCSLRSLRGYVCGYRRQPAQTIQDYARDKGHLGGNAATCAEPNLPGGLNSVGLRSRQYDCP